MLQLSEGVYIFLKYCFCFLQILRSRIAELYGSSVFIFIFWGNIILYCFLYWLYQLTFPPQCTRVPFLHIHQYLLRLVFLITALLIGVGWYLIMVLICISLMISVQSIFSCIYWLSMPCLEKCLFRSSESNWFFFFLCCWVLWVLYILWTLSHHELYDLQIFSPIQYVAISFCWWFHLWCSFRGWCGTTCLFLLLLLWLLLSDSKYHH